MDFSSLSILLLFKLHFLHHLKDFERACELVKIKFMRAVKDVETRWNSTHSMLARAIFLKAGINAWTRSKEEYTNLILQDNEWEHVEFLVHFLIPFHRTTTLLQATAIPTLQQTFETYEGLFNAIDNVKAMFKTMHIRPEWIKDVEMGIGKMWDKLKEYYSQDKPFAYGDAIILHPSEKLHWLKTRNWDSALIDQYRQSTKSRFEQEYAVDNRKRSFATLESDDSDSDEEHSEFESYMGHRKQKGVKNPLLWWKSSQEMFPKLAQMARDTYAVPATGSGVEREFSISGNIVNNRRNRLSPKTISDIMQYKRWMARTGVVTKLLKNQEDASIMETELER